MKKLFNCLVATSVLVLGATAAYAETHSDGHHKTHGEMFKAMDTNSDGVVTLEEFNAFHAKKFKALDVNGNGQITQEEMMAGHKKIHDAHDKKMEDKK